ncbi:hypothetical protein M514_11225 [Trichuris suis]|uniref:Uncharacterized protein n=1 Tax=Trichuris suis TaxID=68888 RepID=A0A085LSC6_9BILA|nr:hypothetical protein M513_11225 [Trichuris suis]KFD64639.1 hypothetical protein M514_11225 [Trichuris suis]
MKMRQKEKLLFSNQCGTQKYQLLAELSALPTSRHQRKEVLATSRVGLLREAPMPVQPMWRLSGRNHDPSRLPTPGWNGFGGTTVEAVFGGGTTYNEMECHIRFRVK